jgi:uncharacterized protein (TIGR02186 family)
MTARAARIVPFALTAAIALAAAVAPAASERLVISVSTHRVLITSNFTGTDIVVFGVIEQTDELSSLEAGYDVAVTVRGPKQDFVTRRKERVLGLWINVDSRHFFAVPSYLSVLTTRAPEELGSLDFLRRHSIGLVNHTLAQRIGADFGDVVPQDPFRVGFLRVKDDAGLFHEDPQGVTFVTPSLFRASVPIPGTAPTGIYEIETLLLSEGRQIARETTAIEVVKTGFEEFVARSARDHGFLYGLATAIMALVTGLIATFMFRST